MARKPKTPKEPRMLIWMLERHARVLDALAENKYEGRSRQWVLDTVLESALRQRRVLPSASAQQS